MNRLATVVLGLALAGGCGTRTSIGTFGDEGGLGGAPGSGGALAGDRGTGGDRMLGDAAVASVVSFAEPTTLSVADGDAGHVVLCDLDGDGRLDLVASGYRSVSTWINLGGGVFRAPVTSIESVVVRGIACGDLDGDGNADVVLLNDRAEVFYNGRGALGARVSYAAGSSPVSVALADMDADGRRDIVVANFHVENGDGKVAILLNAGNRSFSSTTFPAGTVEDGIAIGDFNGDSRPDVAVGTGSSFTVVANGGSGALAAPMPFSEGVGPSVIVAGDLNGDRRLDLVVGESGYGGFDIALGLGNGAFAAGVRYTLLATADGGSDTHAPTAAALADFDGDGDLDLVTGNACCGVGVTFNDGHGIFGSTQTVTALSDGIWQQAGAVAVGDLDGDHRPDLVIASGSISVLLNSSH